MDYMDTINAMMRDTAIRNAIENAIKFVRDRVDELSKPVSEP